MEQIQLGKQDIIFAGGSGMIVIDSDHAKIRDAEIYAELVDCGAPSDGYDMVIPSSGEGAIRCMRMVMATVGGEVDYLNAHGTNPSARRYRRNVCHQRSIRRKSPGGRLH